MWAANEDEGEGKERVRNEIDYIFYMLSEGRKESKPIQS